MSFEVSKKRPLCSTKREERHGGRHANVDANHAHPDPVTKLTCGLAALREDRSRVGETRPLYHLDALVEVTHVCDRSDGAEDFFFADRHVGLHAVEHRGTDKVATRVLLDPGRS